MGGGYSKLPNNEVELGPLGSAQLSDLGTVLDKHLGNLQGATSTTAIPLSPAALTQQRTQWIAEVSRFLKQTAVDEKHKETVATHYAFMTQCETTLQSLGVIGNKKHEGELQHSIQQLGLYKASLEACLAAVKMAKNDVSSLDKIKAVFKALNKLPAQWTDFTGALAGFDVSSTFHASIAQLQTDTSKQATFFSLITNFADSETKARLCAPPTGHQPEVYQADKISKKMEAITQLFEKHQTTLLKADTALAGARTNTQNSKQVVIAESVILLGRYLTRLQSDLTACHTALKDMKNALKGSQDPALSYNGQRIPRKTLEEQIKTEAQNRETLERRIFEIQTDLREVLFIDGFQMRLFRAEITPARLAKALLANGFIKDPQDTLETLTTRIGNVTGLPSLDNEEGVYQEKTEIAMTRKILANFLRHEQLDEDLLDKATNGKKKGRHTKKYYGGLHSSDSTLNTHLETYENALLAEATAVSTQKEAAAALAQKRAYQVDMVRVLESHAKRDGLALVEQQAIATQIASILDESDPTKAMLEKPMEYIDGLLKKHKISAPSQNVYVALANQYRVKPAAVRFLHFIERNELIPPSPAAPVAPVSASVSVINVGKQEEDDNAALLIGGKPYTEEEQKFVDAYNTALSALRAEAFDGAKAVLQYQTNHFGRIMVRSALRVMFHETLHLPITEYPAVSYKDYWQEFSGKKEFGQEFSGQQVGELFRVLIDLFGVREVRALQSYYIDGFEDYLAEYYVTSEKLYEKTVSDSSYGVSFAELTESAQATVMEQALVDAKEALLDPAIVSEEKRQALTQEAKGAAMRDMLEYLLKRFEAFNWTTPREDESHEDLLLRRRVILQKLGWKESEYLAKLDHWKKKFNAVARRFGFVDLRITKESHEQKGLNDAFSTVVFKVNRTNAHHDTFHDTVEKRRWRTAKRIISFFAKWLTVIVAVGQGAITKMGMSGLGSTDASRAGLGNAGGAAGTLTNFMLFIQDAKEIMKGIVGSRLNPNRGSGWASMTRLQKVLLVVLGSAGAALAVLFGVFAFVPLALMVGMALAAVVGAVTVLSFAFSFFNAIKALISKLSKRAVLDYFVNTFVDEHWQQKTVGQRALHVAKIGGNLLLGVVTLGIAVICTVVAVLAMRVETQHTILNFAGQLFSTITIDRISTALAGVGGPIEFIFLNRGFTGVFGTIGEKLSAFFARFSKKDRVLVEPQTSPNRTMMQEVALKKSASKTVEVTGLDGSDSSKMSGVMRALQGQLNHPDTTLTKTLHIKASVSSAEFSKIVAKLPKTTVRRLVLDDLKPAQFSGDDLKKIAASKVESIACVGMQMGAMAGVFQALPACRNVTTLELRKPVLESRGADVLSNAAINEHFAHLRMLHIAEVTGTQKGIFEDFFNDEHLGCLSIVKLNNVEDTAALAIVENLLAAKNSSSGNYCPALQTLHLTNLSEDAIEKTLSLLNDTSKNGGHITRLVIGQLDKAAVDALVEKLKNGDVIREVVFSESYVKKMDPAIQQLLEKGLREAAEARQNRGAPTLAVAFVKDENDAYQKYIPVLHTITKTSFLVPLLLNGVGNGLASDGGAKAVEEAIGLPGAVSKGFATIASTALNDAAANGLFKESLKESSKPSASKETPKFGSPIGKFLFSIFASKPVVNSGKPAPTQAVNLSSGASVPVSGGGAQSAFPFPNHQLGSGSNSLGSSGDSTNSGNSGPTSLIP